MVATQAAQGARYCRASQAPEARQLEPEHRGRTCRLSLVPRPMNCTVTQLKSGVDPHRLGQRVDGRKETAKVCGASATACQNGSIEDDSEATAFLARRKAPPTTPRQTGPKSIASLQTWSGGSCSRVPHAVHPETRVVVPTWYGERLEFKGIAGHVRRPRTWPAKPYRRAGS